MKMKAAIYHGVRNVAVEEIEKPVAGPRDVVVRVVRSAICGTDLKAYTDNGDLCCIYPGCQFGHEMGGYISEIGEEVEDLKLGDRVFVFPTRRKPLGRGLKPMEISCQAGAFSEYQHVEEAKLGYNLIKLPDNLSYDRATLIDPLAVSFHAVNWLAPKGNENAVVFGAGMIGLGAICGLKHHGVKNIIAIDLVERRLKAAEEMGAIPCNASKVNDIEFVKSTFGTVKSNFADDVMNVDLIIDAVGAPDNLPKFLNNMKPRSKVVLPAAQKIDIPIVPFRINYNELTVCGSRAYDTEDVYQAVEYLISEDCVAESLITHRFPHAKFPEAIEQASRRDEAIKVLIEYEDHE